MVKRLVEWLVGHRPQQDVAVDSNHAKDLAASISSAIAAENKHVENRFQWNLGLQGFLFASYAIAVGKEKPSELVNKFADIVALVGLTSASVTFIGVGAAYLAINRLKSQWLGGCQQLDPISARPFSEPWPSLIGRLPSTVITAIIFYAWFRLDALL